jgi:hypothetical protein
MRLNYLSVSVTILSMIFSSLAKDSRPLGIYVRDGVAMHQGQSYRAMGINYHNCFSALLKNKDNRDFVEGFRILKQDYSIPYIRFMACPFGHAQWSLYLENKDEYFRRMDMIVNEAQSQELGLIPSFFWYVASVPDLMNESLSELGNANSRSRKFIRKYTSELVRRYKDSPAIYGWEVGNEYMLFADLPKYDHLPPQKTGSDKPRTEKDKLTREMLLDLYEDFHQIVRRLDSDRIIVTGDSIPRAQAWHNHNEDRWAQDTREQWLSRFMADTPDCYDVVSFHLYEEGDGNYFRDENVSIEELVSSMVALCRENEKIVWCGELGMPGTDDKARDMFVRMMKVVENNKIPLSAIWNFIPSGTYQPDWDILPDNDRSYMLDAVKKLNERFALGTAK